MGNYMTLKPLIVGKNVNAHNIHQLNRPGFGRELR
jgi:hypothetical protein